MKRKFTQVEPGIKIIIVTIMVLSIQGCTLFEKDETLLAEHQKTNGEKIKIYYVGLGATTSDVIQVRRESQENPLWVTDKYNCLKSSKLINDSSLQIVLSDSTYYGFSDKLDTMIINLK